MDFKVYDFRNSYSVGNETFFLSLVLVLPDPLLILFSQQSKGEIFLTSDCEYGWVRVGGSDKNQKVYKSVLQVRVLDRK